MFDVFHNLFLHEQDDYSLKNSDLKINVWNVVKWTYLIVSDFNDIKIFTVKTNWSENSGSGSFNAKSSIVFLLEMWLGINIKSK